MMENDKNCVCMIRWSNTANKCKETRTRCGIVRKFCNKLCRQYKFHERIKTELVKLTQIIIWHNKVLL